MYKYIKSSFSSIDKLVDKVMELSYYADPYEFADNYDVSLNEITNENEAYWSEWNQLKSDIANHNTFYIRDFMQYYKESFIDSGDKELAAECEKVITELANKKITSNMSMFGEDDSFWTRDDIDELGYEVADYITENSTNPVEYYSGYANSDKEIEITVVLPDYTEFSTTQTIDFRKIKSPRDLITSYTKVFGDALISEIEDFQKEYELNSSKHPIKASTKPVTAEELEQMAESGTLEEYLTEDQITFLAEECVDDSWLDDEAHYEFNEAKDADPGLDSYGTDSQVWYINTYGLTDAIDRFGTFGIDYERLADFCN